MIIRLSKRAISEMRAAFEYYHDASLRVSQQLLKQIDVTLDLLDVQPRMGHPVSKNVRRINLAQFPYFFLYQPGVSLIKVLRFIHERRHPNQWQDSL